MQTEGMAGWAQRMGAGGEAAWPQAGVSPHEEGSRQIERWPFSVRLAQGQADLAKVIEIRHSAYARHLPEPMCAAFRRPEASDTAAGTYLLLAESKLDGSPLGTMRIQTNEAAALMLESAVELPFWMQGRRLAEATRLGVTNAVSGRLVKTALFKAFYLLCLQRGVDFMVIAARSPVDRQYVRLLFQDVFPGMGGVPLSYAFNLPHRVLYLDVRRVRELWEDARHPLLDFMCHTEHPDLRLGQAR